MTNGLESWQVPLSGRGEGDGIKQMLPPKLHRTTVRESFRHLSQSSPNPMQSAFDKDPMGSAPNMNNNILLNMTSNNGFNEAMILPKISPTRHKPNWHRMTSTT